MSVTGKRNPTMRIARPLTFVLAAFAAVVSFNAPGQTWPTKPVRVVVTFPPGGSSDVVARVIAPLLAEKLGQPLVIDNKPGAGATIGAGEVARAAPDGYTLMLSNTAPISLSPFMLEPPPYDSIKSFTHVAYIGSIGHIVGELFAKEAGIKLNHIGYKGSAPMHNDLLGGTILFAIDTLPQNVQFQKSGKLRLLAVTSIKRTTMAPDVPTVLELGYPNLVAENFFGISGPAGMPKSAIEPLHRATMAALDDPKLVKNFDELGIAVRKMSSEEFTVFVQKQVADWAPAVKASGAKLN